MFEKSAHGIPPGGLTSQQSKKLTKPDDKCLKYTLAYNLVQNLLIILLFCIVVIYFERKVDHLEARLRSVESKFASNYDVNKFSKGENTLTLVETTSPPLIYSRKIREVGSCACPPGPPAPFKILIIELRLDENLIRMIVICLAIIIKHELT
ncbi:hypothetical protein HELRODRAFT_164542 [Helobdella robusta]|uniref:Uncharacterized protein n=1 Tax=Helobdella robusta TaxID=6412 RepID=T1EVK1_HELRO|nr:hypothetical protein HELRODRAFT_164542 [Helobdella robusta]ESN94662.1 hypothetical protein HELRODRAFT_164542 [Helobdella robusta]